jgi:circadian clock protein KaiB
MTMISVSLFVTQRESRRNGFVGSVLRTCERHLAGRCRVTVVNVDEEPHLVAGHGLLATPALEIEFGHERHRIVGDLGHESRLAERLERFAVRP